MNVHITEKLLEKVGHQSQKTPCASRVKHGRNLVVEVAHRPFSDHYVIFEKDGAWIGSFTQNLCFVGIRIVVENLSVRDGCKIIFDVEATVKS